MAVTPTKPEETTAGTPQSGRSGNQEAFRQLLRQADKLIKEGNFEEATRRITEAQHIDPANPFIFAFKERLTIFKGKSSSTTSPNNTPAQTTPKAGQAKEIHTPSPATQEMSREMIEHHVRQQLDAEYKEKFTQALRKAEDHAAKLIQDERANVELHREALRTKFEHQLSETKDQLERDYQRKLKEAEAQSTAILEKQYRESLAKAQQDLAAKLSAAQQAEHQHLQEQIEREKGDLKSREHAAFAERERILRAEFEQQLADALKASEELLRSQSEAKHRTGLEDAEKRLTAEFETRFAEETARWRERLETEKTTLLRDHAGQLRKLEEAQRASADEQERKFRDQELEIRAELKQQLEVKLQEVRDSVRGENEKERRSQIEQREKKLTEEFEGRLSAEQQKWKKELDAQKQKLEASHAEEKKRLAEAHRTELEEQAKNQINPDDVHKKLSAEFEARLAADQERRAREFESQIAGLESARTAERQKLVEERTRELASAEQEYLEKEHRLRSELERQSAESVRQALEAARGKSEEKHRTELEKTQKKLISDFNSRLVTEREALAREYELQKKSLELAHADHDKKLSAAHRKETEKLEKEFQTREKAAIRSREEALRKEFEVQMTNALRKTEESVRNQANERHHTEVQDVRKKVTAEFEARLIAEREKWKREFNAEKQTLEQTFAAKQKALTDAHRKELEKQEKAVRASEEVLFRQQQEALRKQLEADLHRQYQVEIESQRQKFELDAAATLETEKQQLQKSYNELLEAQETRIRSLRTTLQKEMEESFTARMEQFAKEYDYKMELMGTKVPVEAEEKQALYRKKMRELYKDGEPSVSAAKDVLALKEVLDLTFDEHLTIEADVRLELYTEEVERLIMGNEINLRDISALNALKGKFRITVEESTKLEPYILSTIERLAIKGRILVADDDILLLQVVDDLLTHAGYQVIPAVSVDEALGQLNTTSVDIILSDIKFGENELDGFQFFSAVQAQPLLRKIPFVFMSSLRDGVIIRSGVQLGVDDYLTKPVEPELLLAVIEGKLKRYRTFERPPQHRVSITNSEPLQRGLDRERQPWT